MRFALFGLFDSAALLTGIAKTATGKTCNECKTRPVASLEREEGRRVYFEALRFFKTMSNSFKLCSTNFPRGENFFCTSSPSCGPVQDTWSIGIGLCLNAFLQIHFLDSGRKK